MMRPAQRPLRWILLGTFAASSLLLWAGCREESAPLGLPAAKGSASGAAGVETRTEIETAIDAGDDVVVLAFEGTTAITGPTVITESGKYRVANDFAVPSGDGIVVRADHVWLNLGDHTITGPGNKVGRGIVIDGVDHVLVANGKLETFGIGVVLLGASRSAVRKLRIAGGDEFADPPNGVPPQIGIMLVDSFRNRVRRNGLALVNLGLFVRGGGSYDNEIEHNTVRGGTHGLLGICYNPAEGEGPAGPHGDEVEENVLQRFGTGIIASAGSAHNRFAGNRIEYFAAAWRDLNGTNVFRHNRARRITP